MSTFPSSLHTALEEFSSAPRILVALDFDGTLAPLVARPQDARPLPAAVQAIDALQRQERVHVALVSGRNLASLHEVYPQGIPELLAGGHGAERQAPRSLSAAVHNKELNEAQKQLLRQITGQLEELSARFPGTTLEYKPAATVLHVRQASRPDAAAALEAAQEQFQGIAGIKLLPGKEVLDVSVQPGSKGEALQWLKRLVQADAMLFAGDDVTDEEGFSVLGPKDLGIKVGEGKTLAKFRVEDPEELSGLLNILNSMRD